MTLFKDIAMIVGVIVLLYLAWSLFKILAFGCLYTLTIMLDEGWKSLNPANWLWILLCPCIYAFRRALDKSYMYADQITIGEWIFEPPFRIRKKHGDKK